VTFVSKICENEIENELFLNNNDSIVQKEKSQNFHLIIHAKRGKSASALVIPEHDNVIVSVTIINEGHNIRVIKHGKSLDSSSVIDLVFNILLFLHILRKDLSLPHELFFSFVGIIHCKTSDGAQYEVVSRIVNINTENLLGT
jgi:hypothetical protein